MQVKEGQELLLSHVLSYRGKLTQQQIQDEMMMMNQLMIEQGVKKDGPLTTATFGIEDGIEGQLLDIELLIPLEREINVPDRYVFKPIIKIVNALSVRHEGHPGMINNAINLLNEFIVQGNKQVITATYNVTVKEAKSQEEIKDMIIDVYVGCNPCIV